MGFTFNWWGQWNTNYIRLHLEKIISISAYCFYSDEFGTIVLLVIRAASSKWFLGTIPAHILVFTLKTSYFPAIIPPHAFIKCLFHQWCPLLEEYSHYKLEFLVLKVLFNLVFPCYFCVTILNFVQYLVTCSKQVR